VAANVSARILHRAGGGSEHPEKHGNRGDRGLAVWARCGSSRAFLVRDCAGRLWMCFQTGRKAALHSRLPPGAGERMIAYSPGARHAGAAVDEARLGTRYRPVTFGFTTCPNVVRSTDGGLSALEQLGHDAARILPVFVSVDRNAIHRGRCRPT